jgi:hypothetical protein
MTQSGLFAFVLELFFLASNEAERGGIWTWINGEIIIGKCGRSKDMKTHTQTHKHFQTQLHTYTNTQVKLTLL